MMRLVAFFLLFGLHSQIAAKVLDDRPVTEVVKMLQDMLVKSKHEGDEEGKLFENYKCYCDENEEAKTQSIKDRAYEISVLESDLETLKGLNGVLGSDISKLQADLVANEVSRVNAKAQHTKSLDAFMEEKAVLEDSIKRLGQAIDQLTDVGGDQTLRSGADHDKFMAKSSLLGLRSNVKHVLATIHAYLKPVERVQMETFLQIPFTGTYTAQSVEVVGILKQMSQTFKANLESAIDEAAIELKAYEGFMSAKMQEAEHATALLNKDLETLRNNKEENSVKMESLSNAQTARTSDEIFLTELRASCEAKAKDNDVRNVLRAQEESAIAQAIAILNSDEAFGTFGKVTSFLQLQSFEPLKALFLENTARWSERSRRTLALLESGNPFATILAEIEKMMKTIDDEEQVDTEKHEWCKTTRKEQAGEISNLNESINGLHATIVDDVETIKHPVNGIVIQLEDIATELQSNAQEQRQITKNRAEENAEHKSHISSVLKAEDLLMKAISVLKGYYAQIMLQKSREVPSTWEGDYAGQSPQGKKVIGLLQYILKDTKQQEELARSNEQASLKAYEEMVTTLKAADTELHTQQAELEVRLTTITKALESNREELKATKDSKAGVLKLLQQIKPGCDFLDVNIHLRSENREQEKKALAGAIDAIKGSAVYQNAVVAAEHQALGKCKKACLSAPDHVTCKACLAKVTEPGYCVAHPSTSGC